MQLLGRRDGLPETEPGEVRVDVTLSATTPWGSDLSLPEPASLQAWASAVKAALEPLLDLGAIGAADGSTRVLGCLEGPFVEAACDEGGHLRLRRLEAKAFELVAVPRQWDDPQRPPEPDVCEQLGDLASRLVNARRAWRTALEALRPHGLKPS